MPTTIRSEQPHDWSAVRKVHQQAFAGPGEAQLVEQLRQAGLASISLVAVETGPPAQVVGHILYSPITVNSGQQQAAGLALAPLAVLPQWQKQGIGSRLIHSSIQQSRQLGVAFLMVLGHPHYYPKFGFSAELARNIHCPFGSGEAWMALELITGSLEGLTGSVQYSRPFYQLEAP